MHIMNSKLSTRIGVDNFAYRPVYTLSRSLEKEWRFIPCYLFSVRFPIPPFLLSLTRIRLLHPTGISPPANILSFLITTNKIGTKFKKRYDQIEWMNLDESKRNIESTSRKTVFSSLSKTCFECYAIYIFRHQYI